MTQDIEIAVGEEFEPYVEAALMRVGYLYSDTGAIYDKARRVICLRATGELAADVIAKEVRYALYRERIFKETIPIRARILGASE